MHGAHGSSRLRTAVAARGRQGNEGPCPGSSQSRLQNVLPVEHAVGVTRVARDVDGVTDDKAARGLEEALFAESRGLRSGSAGAPGGASTAGPAMIVAAAIRRAAAAAAPASRLVLEIEELIMSAVLGGAASVRRAAR